MSDDLDPKYMSQELREKIESAKKELKDNPVTWRDNLLSSFRVNVYYPIYVWVLKMIITVKKFLLGK